MLEALTMRINRAAAEILESEDSSASEKYYRLYDHIKASDRIIADCFDGWKRSSISIFASNLLREDLISDDTLGRFSESGRSVLIEIQRIREM
ncbi:MAG: hypothetical protein P1U86_18945 [Verrucomicrobiales bacterium]|nr:hypothetical protein [Verrucomicrobiales bacterium]